MKVKTNIKMIIGIVGTLAAGFIGFQMLKTELSDMEEAQLIIKVVKPEDRRITMPPFVKRASETGAKTQQEETNVESPDLGTPPVPENVPTAQSGDDEIREFQDWLSLVLEQEADDPVEETEQVDLTAGDGMTTQHQNHKAPRCLKVVFTCVPDDYLLKYSAMRKNKKYLRLRINKEKKSAKKVDSDFS